MSFSFTKKGFNPFVVNASRLPSGSASIQSDCDEPLSATNIIESFIVSAQFGISNLAKIALTCNFLAQEIKTSIHFEHTCDLFQRQFGQLRLILGSTIACAGIYEEIGRAHV